MLQPTQAEVALNTQLAAMRAGLVNEGTWRGELRQHRRNGEACLLQVTVTAVRDANLDQLRADRGSLHRPWHRRASAKQ